MLTAIILILISLVGLYFFKSNKKQPVITEAYQPKAEAPSQPDQRGFNTPYVKQYDESGNCTNPIKEGYFSPYQNRQTRRQHLKNPTLKEGQFIQRILLKSGLIKIITHQR